MCYSYVLYLSDMSDFACFGSVGVLAVCVFVFTVFLYCFVYVYLFLFVRVHLKRDCTP